MSGPRRLRRLAVLAVLALALGGLAGCGDDDGGASAAAGDATSIPDEGRPPTKFSELEAIFNPILEPLGLVLTRGALIDRADNGYEVSEDGRHLALYAEPIDDEGSSPEEVAANFYDLTAATVPYVFERWSELDTFDICQEPPTTVDDRPEPFPDTQIDITREASESFDWENGTLVDLLTLDLEERDVRTVIHERVREAEPYKSAYAEAQQRVVEATSFSAVPPDGPSTSTAPN